MSAAPPSLTIEDALSKLRPHTSSKLPHQKKPALLLKALESSLPEPITPTAYYAALVQTLQQAVTKDLSSSDDGELQVGEGDLVPAVLYLLSTVIDFVPPAVYHAQNELGLLGPLFSSASLPESSESQSLLSLFAPCSTSAPSLRSLIHILQQLLLSAPTLALTTNPYVSTLNTLLSVSLDSRPRVRKMAQEAVRDVLAAPPPPAVRHPYAERVAKWLVKVLSERVRSDEGEQRRIWAVGFVRIVAASWPSDQITPLLSVLLPLPAHPHLQATTLSLLSHLLSQSTSQNSLEAHKIPLLLLEILNTPPTDNSVIPSWLEVVENGMVSWSREDPSACSAEFGRVWSLVWGYLSGDSGKERGVGKAAERALVGMARYCITEEMMTAAIDEKIKVGGALGVSPAAPKSKGPGKKQIHPQDQKVSATSPILAQIIANLQTSLHALRALPFLPSTLTILSSLISRLRIRPSSVSTPTKASEYDPRMATAAQWLILDLVRDVGGLRIQKGFENKEKADEVLGMAIEVVGPEGVLEALPLNVEANRDPSEPGRAFLLPLLRNRTTNTSLAYFTKVMVPLSERLFNAKTASESVRPIEAKVYEALVDQVWACLKGFCDVPIDLTKAFTNEFAALITQVLYTQPSLRPTLLRSLQTLVETSRSLSTSSAPSAELLSSFGLDQSAGRQNLAFLKSMAKNLLAVLFNVFSQVGREQRGMVGEVITSYLGVTSETDINATYTKVVTHLGQALQVPYNKATSGGTGPGQASPTSHTMLDLLILLVPFLPKESAQALFAHATGETLIGSDDPAVQKKSYRVLARLIETKKVLVGGEGIEPFVKRLVDGSEVVAAAARRDRVLLLAVLIPVFPTDQLHLIPSLLPEAVLGTKEVNEKTRDAAFELVVLMGNKMSEGGTIKRGLVDGMEEDEMADASANIPEYITMVAAGLAGTSPHMISATITAISRLLFEFKDSIPGSMINDLIATLAVFISSNNREIVKSSLGFVKVIVVTLTAADVRPHLPALVPGLLGWSHDHKNHFKGKVRHIFERLIRKFGYEDVAKQAEGVEGDGIKFLENIRKRKERSKRKKAAKQDAAEGAGEMSDDDEPSKPRTSTGNAFEDALYGSESELDDSDDEMGGAQRGDQNGPKGKGKGKGREKDARGPQYIREDGDEPMDLLDRTLAGRISQNDPNAASRRRKPGQEASKFKTDADTGRMLINEDSDNEASGAASGSRIEEDVEGRAYQDQLTSTEGMTRGRGGKVIFNKDTKRGRATEAEGDVTMGNATTSAPKKAKKEKQTKTKVGGEFKAKHAGGDVKRAGAPDPFAYVPLSAVGRKGKKDGLNITGKKRGSAH